ncbi:cohesin subunit SA-2-like isoform X2 [Ischnura elegans]|uniref:cohesin subunit SA-2-like isoform X2 n=1 Tax=Ischnura elegans TaxID=197161 RepID=UPI001ED89117|nr:cohesin subunit SA-2-like isoform X2 [Ischnura elegans]
MLRRGGRRPRALSSTAINELAATAVSLPENFTAYTIDQGDGAIVHATDGQGISFVEQYIDGPTIEAVSAHTVDDRQTTLVQTGGHFVEAILEDDGDVRVIQLQEVVEELSPPSSRGRGRGRGRGGLGGLKRAALAPVASVLMGGPPKRRRPGRRPITELQAEDENSLCYIIREQKATVQQVVEGWVQSYWLSRDGALLSLTQFFFNASGCKGKITQSMQATMEYTDIIAKMAEEFDDTMGSDYPLILNAPPWKKFRENTAEFIQRLIKHGHKERPPLGVMPMLHDQCLMDNLVSFLIALSDSNVRAFRHTATYAGIKMMTALVDVIQTTVGTIEGLRHFRHAGLLKGYRSGGGSVTLKRQELEENLEELKNILSYMFKSIFAVRYRDTLPEIRSICLAELGQWMFKYPNHFLTDSYLKYIGWSLNDRVGAVRLNCLQALKPLYDSETHRGKLELFTSKFKSRLVGMRADKEYDVAVEAVKLVTSILKYHPDALTDADCEQIYELLYEVHRGVALAAGEFLQQKLFVPKTNSLEKPLNKELLCDLVYFFTAHQLHEHALYLVDSLIDTTPILKDWESMIKLLLMEESLISEVEDPASSPLDESQQIALVEIMTCAIRQAATGEPPLCRGTSRKVMTTSELKQVGDDRAALSEHFLKALPQLLSKFMQHPEAVKNLMAIPQFCELQLFSLNNMEEELEGLLQLICQVMHSHSDREVIKMTVKTLEKLCEMGSERFPKCEAVRTVLTESIVTQFKLAMQHHSTCSKQGELPDMSELLELTEITHKLSILYGCHDVGPWGVWDSVFETVQNLNSVQLPDEVLKNCMTIAYFSILWDFACLMDNDGQDSSNAVKGRDATHLELLRTRVISFVYILRNAIQTCPVELLREEAFILLCDLLIHLRNGDYGSGPLHCRWGVLPSYPVDEELQELLNDFIQREVFTEFQTTGGEAVDSEDDELKKFELHKRRCFLASFCKLIVYNVMPITMASNVFKHYLKFGEQYGDIIKATLSKARDINKVECARTMVLSLMTLFSEMCDKSDVHMKLGNASEEQDGDTNSEERSNGVTVDRCSEEFLSLKEMAKRFALSFGLDSVKNREAVTALHRDGILFAVQPMDDPLGSGAPPPNLPFLEILAEFTFKLLNQDKRVVLSYLDQRIATGMASGSGEDWKPLLLYRNSLVHGESTSATPILPVTPPAGTVSTIPVADPATKPQPKSSPKNIRILSQEEEEEEEDDVQSILPGKLQMEEVVVEPSTEFFTGSWIPAVSILPGYSEAGSSHSGVRQKRDKSSASGSG